MMRRRVQARPQKLLTTSQKRKKGPHGRKWNTRKIALVVLFSGVVFVLGFSIGEIRRTRGKPPESDETNQEQLKEATGLRQQLEHTADRHQPHSKAQIPEALRKEMEKMKKPIPLPTREELNDMEKLPMETFMKTRTCAGLNPATQIDFRHRKHIPDAGRMHKLRYMKQKIATDPVIWDTQPNEFSSPAKFKHHELERFQENHASLAEKQQGMRRCLEHVTGQLDAWNLEYMLFFDSLLGAYRYHDWIADTDDTSAAIAMEAVAVEKLREYLWEWRLKKDIQEAPMIHRADERHHDKRHHDKRHHDKRNPWHRKHALSPPGNCQWIVTMDIMSQSNPMRIVDLETGGVVEIYQLLSLIDDDRNYFEVYPGLGCFHPDTIFPTKPCRLGNALYWCPNDPRAALVLSYREGLGHSGAAAGKVVYDEVAFK